MLRIPMLYEVTKVKKKLENRIKDAMKGSQKELELTPEEQIIYERSTQLPNGLSTGDYLLDVNPFEGFTFPSWIEGSIIRIDGYISTTKHIKGVGIRRGHPCELKEAGWEYDQLQGEILFMQMWRVVQEPELLTYCADNKIHLVENYNSCKVAKPGYHF